MVFMLTVQNTIIAKSDTCIDNPSCLPMLK